MLEPSKASIHLTSLVENRVDGSEEELRHNIRTSLQRNHSFAVRCGAHDDDEMMVGWMTRAKAVVFVLKRRQRWFERLCLEYGILDVH